MILDIEKFIEKEQPAWKELEELLELIDRQGDSRLNLNESKRLFYLYERVSEDLAKVSTFSGERSIRDYLENLLSRAYSNIYSQKKSKLGFNPFVWLTRGFPVAFRRNMNMFLLACAVTLVGFVFGGVAVAIDGDAKKAIFPEQFGHLHQSPEDRVNSEENSDGPNRLSGAHSTFAAALMTNNIKVSILVLALGVSWGIGTMVVLFYNGVILGAVALDFMLAGQTAFLLGWLMPHGVIEIPAIIIAGQGGFILGSCLLKGRGHRIKSLKEKSDDIIGLIVGVAALLVWAGIVESFISQFHEPVLPYSVKIAFGCIEFAALVVYLGWCGRKKNSPEEV